MKPTMSLDSEYSIEDIDEIDKRYLSPNINDGWTKVLDFENRRAAAIEKKVLENKSKDIEVPRIVIDSPKPKKIRKQWSLDSKQNPKRMGRRNKVGVITEENNVSSAHRSKDHHPFEHSNSVAHIFTNQFLHRDNYHTDELLSKFTKEELDEFHQLFSMFDTDGSGAIGSQELKEAIMSIGLQVNDAEIDRLIKEVDEDGNGEIDFAEFCDCMKKSQNLAKSTNEEVIKQCFEIFDQDHNGMITENEFKYIAKEVGDFSDELAVHVFNELDISSNGYLSADQFAAIVEDYLLSDPYRN